MKRAIIYFFLTTGFAAAALAGTGGGKKATSHFINGEKEYASQRYIYAIPFLKASLGSKNQNDSLALLHIADSYWYTRNYDSALTYYQRFNEKYGRLFSASQRIAELFANKGEYASSVKIYQQLLKEIPAHDEKLLKARLKGFSSINGFLKDSLNYTTHLLNLNTGQQDFSPQYFENGIVFVSNRYSKRRAEKEFGWDGLPFAGIYRVKDTLDLYTADSAAARSLHSTRLSIKVNDDYTAHTSNDNDIILVNHTRSDYNATIQQLERFSDELNSKYNYGPLCFNRKGDVVYFTRNNLVPGNGRYNLEICEARLENGKWGRIKVMPFVQKNYDFYHPALNAEENRLYFCSNMPGGLGKSDIYYVSLMSDYDKGLPINLDDKINTSGNELFPTIHGDTLFFSSDGHPGLGGLDIYSTQLTRGNWKTPVNLGYPVNTSFDDFGIIYNGSTTRGLFSSNRLGTDDLYLFEKRSFVVTLSGDVLNRKDMRKLERLKVIIQSTDPEEPMKDSLVTDLTGIYQFTVKPGRDYSLSFSREGFVPENVPALNSGTEVRKNIGSVMLTPLAEIKPAVEQDRDKDSVPDVKDKCPDVKGTVSNHGCPDIQARINELAKMVFFKTASDQLTEAAKKPLNEVVQYLKEFPNLILSIEGHTDNKAGAAYNLDLSRRRAASVKKFFTSRGFDAIRFTAEGFGLERPIADNSTEEGRAVNRRVAIKATFK